MRGKYGTISERKLQAGGYRDGTEEFQIIKTEGGCVVGDWGCVVGGGRGGRVIPAV